MVPSLALQSAVPRVASSGVMRRSCRCKAPFLALHRGAARRTNSDAAAQMNCIEQSEVKRTRQYSPKRLGCLLASLANRWLRCTEPPMLMTDGLRRRRRDAFVVVMA